MQRIVKVLSVVLLFVLLAPSLSSALPQDSQGALTEDMLKNNDPMRYPTEPVARQFQSQGNKPVGLPEPTPTATEQPTAEAADGTQSEPQPQRIQLAVGAISDQVQGTLDAEQMTHYILRAFAGQTMTVTVAPGDADDPQAILIIYGKDGDVLISDHAGATTWSGPLPSTQDYLIDLRSVVTETISYTLDVEIPPLPK